MAIYNSLVDLIGRTPILKLEEFSKSYSMVGKLYGKLEMYNPAGSVKDRAARQMIIDAEKSGQLFPGATIIEPTSGNTGIGLASVALSRGYHTILTMPDSMSEERRKLLKAYGAQVVLTEGARGMEGAVEKAKQIQEQTPHSIILGQFENKSNMLAHYHSTGPEIWMDFEGRVDVFVCGIGTGGTISGVGRYLKEMNPGIQIIGVEPAESPLITKGESGSHGIQGIGANFVPPILDQTVIDEIITVSTEEAYAATKEMLKTQGVFTGISSGAALHAATVVGSRISSKGMNIVVLLPDSGERYLSTDLCR